MNILYLHGYQSSLKPGKREILESYGSIYAPDLNYDKPKSLFESIERFNAKFDCIVGSSAGGLLGFYYSRKIDVPALLFNPALNFYEEKFGKEIAQDGNNLYQRFILGMKDKVVSAKDTLQFLENHSLINSNIDIVKIEDLQHQISLSVFAFECKAFFDLDKFS